MAKIRVKVAKALFEERDMKLNSIHISRHSKTGYLVPAHWNEVEKMTDLGLAQSMNAFRAESLDLYTHNCSVTPSLEKNTYEENSWTMLRCYIPETYNFHHDNLDSEELCLSVEYFSDGDETAAKKHDILFRFYNPETGKPDMTKNPWDLIRNHIYEFVITGIEPLTGDLLVSVNTDWWEKHHLGI